MMKKMALFSVLASAIVMSLASCASPTAPSVSPQPGASAEVLAARDAALTYVREHYVELAPGPGLAWLEERVTPEGLVGAETFRYTTQDWELTISYPVVPPESVVYQVTIQGVTTTFHWEGEVDAQGTVTEISAPELMLDRIGARDAALTYLREHYEDPPPESLSWEEEEITPEGLVGAATYQYTAEDWVVEISYPIVAPAAMIYHVRVTNPGLNFDWHGSVDAQGVVTEEM